MDTMHFNEADELQRSPISRPSSIENLSDRPNALLLADVSESRAVPLAATGVRQQPSEYSMPPQQLEDVETSATMSLQSIPSTAPQSPSSGNSASSGTDKHLPRRRRLPWLKLWAWELLGAVFSISCMAGVVAILTSVQDKTLDEWKMPISPNALVAVFTTLTKSSLLLIVAEGISQLKWIYSQERRHRLFDLQLFDAASRGPWGAVQLLYGLRLHAIIASTGALLTILCLAMDPFSQQIISYNATMVNSSAGTALVRNAQSYDDRLAIVTVNNSGIHDVDVNSNGESYVRMTTTAFKSMFKANASVEFRCSSGTCTFPEFESIGVCCDCLNETAIVVPRCRGSGNSSRYQECSYSSSKEHDLTAFFTNETFNGPPYWGTFVADWTTLNTTVWTPKQGDISPFLAKIRALSNSDSPKLKGWTWPRPAVYFCNLYVCNQRRTAVVTNGIMVERVIDSEPLLFPDYGISSSDDNTAVCPGFTKSNMPTNIESNRTVLESPEVRWINFSDMQQIAAWIKSTFSVITQESKKNDPDKGFSTVMANMLYTLNDGNIMQTMDDVATSLTNAIREGPNSTWVAGQAQVPATIVLVHWPWITLPLALVFLGIVFLAISIAFSSEAGRFVWKLSILGTVYHRLEGFSADEMDVRSLEEMEQSAKKMQVVLAEGFDSRVSLCR